MKILYAIQGTGNGHLARAEDIVPALRKKATVEIFVSGAQADIHVPYGIDHRSAGVSFYFGKNGGVDIAKTLRKNHSRRVYNEVMNFPVEKYDLVVNDFEPISAWAARKKHVPCIALSHQASLLSRRVPKPKHFDILGDWILKNYAPSNHQVGFHFNEFDRNIVTPVIRERIRKAEKVRKDHYTVYLPAYADEKIVRLLIHFPEVQWHIFSRHTDVPYHVGKLSVFPINNEAFVQSLTSSKGVLCGAGFETPAEALYLKKKLLVIPMKKQYEQFYNAAALRTLGVPVLKKLRKKNLPIIQEWIESDKVVDIHYEDVAAKAVDMCLSMLD